MAALKIGRNIISVECNANQFIHSKLRAVSELPDLQDDKHEEKNEEENYDSEKEI